MELDKIEALVKNAVEKEDKTAKEEIIINFQPFIKKFSGSIFIHGYDRYDIENECYRALLKALMYYDTSRKAFVAFAIRTIKNSLYEILRRAKVREETDGAEALIFTEGLENTLISEELPIEEQLFKFMDNLLLRNALDKLDPDEKVFINHLFIEGKTLRKYAEEYSISYNEAFALRMRIIRKLRKIIGGKNEFNLYVKG